MSIEFWSFGGSAGYQVKWYRDDAGNEGWGDNPRYAAWGAGSGLEAAELAKRESPPAGAVWGWVRDGYFYETGEWPAESLAGVA